jgi:hypothetical protein
MGYSTVIRRTTEYLGAALALHVPVCFIQMRSKPSAVEVDKGQLDAYFKSRYSETQDRGKPGTFLLRNCICLDSVCGNGRRRKALSSFRRSHLKGAFYA